MIRFTETALELSQAVCKALLSFSSKDSTREHICGIGINQGDPCATDGKSAIRFAVPTLPRSNVLPPEKFAQYNGRVFAREYVELQARLAKANKIDLVTLNLNCLTSLRFPPLDQVESKVERLDFALARGIEPAFLDRFMAVCEACRAPDRAKKDLPYVKFQYIGEPLDAMTFIVDDTAAGGNHAKVTLMPVRID